MNARHAAIARALELHLPVDLDEWAEWVASTDELTDTERAHVLAATADDLRTVAAALEAQAIAALDQSAAHRTAVDVFLAELRPWVIDPDETIRETLEDVAELDPDAHRRLVALARSAFPTGLVEVQR